MLMNRFLLAAAFFFVLISLIASCSESTGELSRNTPNYLPLVNGLRLELLDSEQVSDSTVACGEAWSRMYGSTTEQVPLFRCIQGDSSVLYVGLPVRTTLRRLEELNIFGLPKAALLSESEEGVYFYKRHRTDSLIYAEYCRQFNRTLVCVVGATASDGRADSLLNRKSIANRFKQE